MDDEYSIELDIERNRVKFLTKRNKDYKSKIEELEDFIMKMCTGCGRLDSEPIGKEHLACCPDSDYKEVPKYFVGIITLDKDKIKELEKVVKDLKGKIKENYELGLKHGQSKG